MSQNSIRSVLFSKPMIFFYMGGWTSKSPADGSKFLSLPKCICSQEVASSCLGKDLSAWRRSPISGTDYSGRDHITVKDCFWIAGLVMKHSLSVSELHTVCSILEANDLLLYGGWTSKSPADGSKFLSLPKCICSQEVASSCLGKDLSAWRRSPISGTDYSGRDHITVKDCFWIAGLVMKHSLSVSERFVLFA